MNDKGKKTNLRIKVVGGKILLLMNGEEARSM